MLSLEDLATCLEDLDYGALAFDWDLEMTLGWCIATLGGVLCSWSFAAYGGDIWRCLGFFDWWHGDFATLMTWRLVARVGGWLGDSSCSTFYWQAGACYPWGLDSSNPSWLDPREYKLGLVKRVGALISVGAEKIWEDWSLPQHIVSNGFYQYTIEFSIHIWCLLSMWLIYCYNAFMVNKCGICYIRTGYKKLLGKVIKIGKSVHTLIHPPSQCDCCVQHIKHAKHVIKI